ncbi:uncharacterized protein LOC115624221 [Scaptodrosophila lebanonensis]|uniref:Uncharacterized protein LOC115624221 n=1 Tax=Drosophila lebanonensis TaxID=7225 RepID=A0A6J2TGW1_DROLE|nr:uncharacterized protein LOC115624221 [Scaptodrosophila lebanonensis]
MYTCNGNDEIYGAPAALPNSEISNPEIKKVSDLLISWNLPQLCPKFQEQEICENALKCLNNADISELIPKVGPRAIFRSKLHKWKAQFKIEGETIVAGKMLVKEECEDAEDTEEDEHSSNNIYTTDEERKDETQFNLNVHEILSLCAGGQKALKFYAKHSYLDSHSRRLVVQSITHAALEQGVPMPPSSFNSIAMQIVKLFPTEHFETYYVPRRGHTNPRGMLHHKYFNTCRRLRPQTQLKQRTIRRGGIEKKQTIGLDLGHFGYPFADFVNVQEMSKAGHTM